MLGKYVRVRITQPIGSQNKQLDFLYSVNYGIIDDSGKGSSIQGAYIMGINHPVKNFEGRVVANVKRADGTKVLVVAPKSSRYIINDIRNAVDPCESAYGEYSIECLYESSCGAVVFRKINGETRFLLIKNKRSANWGFPKGHIENGETRQQTAMREVLEETGLRITIIPEFVSKSEYTIQGRVEKSVSIFLAKTSDTQTRIQREEIEDYVWLNFERAMETLKFENDRSILEKAVDFLENAGITDEVQV